MRSLWASRTRLFRGGGVGLRCVLAGTTGNALAFGGPFIFGFLLATSHSLLLGHARLVGILCASSSALLLSLFCSFGRIGAIRCPFVDGGSLLGGATLRALAVLRISVLDDRRHKCHGAALGA